MRTLYACQPVALERPSAFRSRADLHAVRSKCRVWRLKPVRAITCSPISRGQCFNDYGSLARSLARRSLAAGANHGTRSATAYGHEHGLADLAWAHRRGGHLRALVPGHCPDLARRGLDARHDEPRDSCVAWLADAGPITHGRTGPWRCNHSRFCLGRAASEPPISRCRHYEPAQKQRIVCLITLSER